MEVLLHELCPVCLEHQARGTSGIAYEKVLCPRCGVFEVEGSAIPAMVSEDPPPEPGLPRLGKQWSEARLRASAWIRETRPRKIHYRDLERIASLPLVPVLERVDRLLVAMTSATEHPGHVIDLNQPEWRARCRAADRSAVVGMAGLLEELGLARRGQGTLGQGGKDPVTVSAGGWQRLAQLQQPNVESEQAFVAMSFSDELQPVFDEVIAPAIRAAGYRPHRVDNREHSGKICDEIVAQIRRSRFVVADYTEHRGGVYWEAGFAKGLGLEVIPTCRKDDIGDIHFDVRQYNTIDWKECDDFKKRLTYRIVATLGPGPLASPEEEEDEV